MKAGLSKMPNLGPIQNKCHEMFFSFSMKLKERILMVILGFSLALILVLFFESAARDLSLGSPAAALPE